MPNKQQTPPRLVKGFRDILPQQAAQREYAMRILQDVFHLFGYQPIDTPTLEYADVLLSKSAGETEKQIFRFQDAGGRDVAMRFDLTVPFARFLAMHRHELGLPFRRYHIGKAWRGENPQRGRYREFYQCDFDMVGSTGVQADLDILLVAQASLSALGVQNFKIRINHRQLLRDLLTHWNLQSDYLAVLSVLDKIHKVGKEKTLADLNSLTPQYAEKIWEFIQPRKDNKESLQYMQSFFEKLGLQTTAPEHTRQIFEQLEILGLGNYYLFDPCITRGLDYYTGIVFETFLDNMEDIGSVCSGGRYDNLVGLYSNEEISGVGGSVGLDRLLAALEGTAQALPKPAAADVLLMNTGNMAPQRLLQSALQKQGIRAVCFPEEKKPEQQFRYAESLGASTAVFYKEKEGYILRDLHTRTNTPAGDTEEALLYIRKTLNGQTHSK